MVLYGDYSQYNIVITLYGNRSWLDWVWWSFSNKITMLYTWNNIILWVNYISTHKKSHWNRNLQNLINDKKRPRDGSISTYKVVSCISFLQMFFLSLLKKKKTQQTIQTQPLISWPHHSFSFAWLTFSSIQSSFSVVSNSSRPCGLQHSRIPCPSPTPGVHSNLCPNSQWCHPTISLFVTPSPPAFNLSQHRGLFQE